MANEIRTKLIIDAEIKDLEAGLAKAKQGFEKLDLGDAMTQSVHKNIGKIENEIEQLKQKTSGDIDLIDEKTIKRTLGNVKKEIQNLSNKSQTKSFNGAAAKIDAKDYEKLTSAVAKYQKEVDSAKNKEEAATKKITQQLDEEYKKQKELAEIEKLRKEITDERNRVAAKPVNSSKGKDGSEEHPFDKRTTGHLEELNAQYAQVAQRFKELSSANPSKKIEELNTKLEQAKQTSSDAVNSAFEPLKQVLNELGIDTTNVTSFDQLKGSIENLKNEMTATADAARDNVKEGLNQAAGAANNASVATDKAGESLERLNMEARDSEQLKQRLTYFFGLANALNLVRRAARQAFQIVKALDEAMTATAVVTDFSVGDMWDKLPQYTQTANKLGATIQGTYETMTLFYQQGLKTNEVFEVGTETIKMAKIAGLDYAEATDRMTAALRGFNMEINEESAQRVADVYSNLAAKTAANVNEISVAMTKTASLASNAGMEFETTAAFLSQIIETTRESAETAGTALKTVIARFEELKKDPSEIGEVDGEVIDANKIETALRTVGVALRDTSGQFRNLDDVFMELASKWDDLDMNTQRYIATIAAGSRQQSRFIAMMSNYARTTELVGLAQNSAGAANEQFEKTLEGLDAKLSKLQNSYNTFITGIFNNGAIKTGVDTLNGILTLLNKMTSIGPSWLQTFEKFGLAFVIFKAARRTINALIPAINAAKKATVDGTTATAAFGSAFKQAWSKKKVTDINAINISLKQYQDSLAKEAALQGAINGLDKRFKENKIEAARLNSELATTEAFKNQQLQQYLVLNGLNNEQQLIANSLINEGFEADVAALAAKSGLTKAKMEELGITGALTREEQLEALAKQGVIAADEKEYSLNQLSLLQKIKYIALLLFGNKEKRQEALERLINAGMIKNETKAQMALNAAMLACPIGWIIAAIGALIAILVGVAALVETDAEKLARLNKINKELASEIEDTNEQINTLTTAHDDLLVLEDDFRNLTKGTAEWNEKLGEINNKVLDLIKTYPELTEFVSTDANGMMKVSEEGWDTVIQNQKDLLQTQQAALAINTVEKNNLVNKMSVEDAHNKGQGKKFAQYMKSTIPGWALIDLLSGKSTGWDAFSLLGPLGPAALGIADWISGGQVSTDMVAKKTAAQTGLDNDAYEQFLTDMSNKGLVFSNNNKEALKELWKQNAGPEATDKQWEKFWKELEKTDERLEKTGYSLDELAKSTANLNKQNELQTKNAINSVINGSFAESEFKDQLAGALQMSSEELEKRTEKVNNEVKGYSNKNLYKAYLQMQGKSGTADEIANLKAAIKNGDISKATIRAEVSASKINEELEKELAKTNNELVRISKLNKDKNQYKPLIQALTNGGLGLDKNSLDYLKNEVKGESDYNRFLSALDTTAEELGLTYDEFNKLVETADVVFSDVDKKLERFGIESEIIATNFQGLSASQYEAFANQLVNFEIAGGNAVNYMNELATVFKDLDKDSQEYKELLDYVLSGQMNTIQEWETFASKAEELGVTLREDLIPNLIAATKATRILSSDGIKSLLSSTLEITQDLKERIEENNREFKEEDYEKIKTLLGNNFRESDFIFDGLSYFYVGADKIKDLLTKVNNNTKEKLLESEEALNEQKRQGNVFGDKVGSSNSKIIEQFAKAIIWSGKTIQDGMLNGVDTKSIQIKYNDTNKDEIKDELKEVIDENDKRLLKALSIEFSDKTTKALAYEQIATYYNNFINLEQIEDNIRQNATSQGVYERMRSGEEDIFNVANKSDIDYIQALDWLLSREGITKDFQNIIKGIYGDLGLDDPEIIDNQLKAAAYLVDKWSEKEKTARESLDESLEKWQSDDMTLQLIGMYEVQNTFEKLFGENIKKLDNTWYSDNQTLIQQWASGSKEAFDEIILKLKKTLLEALDETKKAALGTDVYGFLSGSDLDTVIRGEGAWYNTEGLFGEMTEERVNALNDALDSLGLMAVYTGKEVKTLGAITRKESIDLTAANNDYIKSIKDLEVEFDKWINLVTEITRLQSELNDLEQEYADKLALGTPSLQEILALQDEINDNYAKQAGKLETLWGHRYDDAIAFGETSKYYGKYWSYDNQGNVIRDDALNTILNNPELYEDIDKEISKAEELGKAANAVEDQLKDLRKTISDKIAQARQDVIDLKNDIYDALVQLRQKEIDKLSEVNESINDANSDLMNAVRDELSRTRQTIESQKKQQDLVDKRQRLAYLKMDTSGANRQEILQLEKELAEAEESYTNELIDQKIDELEDQNDKAAEQRQNQIDLLQAQLDYEEESGQFWEEANRIFEEAIAGNTQELMNILSQTENWQRMSEEAQTKRVAEINGTIGNIQTYLGGTLSTLYTNLSLAIDELNNKTWGVEPQKNPEPTNPEPAEPKKDPVEPTVDLNYETYKQLIQGLRSNYNSISDEYQAQKNNMQYLDTELATRYKDKWDEIYSSIGSKLKNAEQALNNKEYAKIDGLALDFQDLVEQAMELLRKVADGYIGPTGVTGQSKINTTPKLYVPAENTAAAAQIQLYDNSGINTSSLPPIEKTKKQFTETYSQEEFNAKKRSDSQGSIYFPYPDDSSKYVKIGDGGLIVPGVYGKVTIEFLKDRRLYEKFASGGLNTHTGPAWLDGTPSKPELVLNSTDTQNFLKLKDILSDIMSRSGNLPTQGGDNYYDIQIGVESVGSDYDVDRMMERIKENIVSDASYRNVTAINRLR